MAPPQAQQIIVHGVRADLGAGGVAAERDRSQRRLAGDGPTSSVRVQELSTPLTRHSHIL